MNHKIVSIDKLRPDPNQPRKFFDAETIVALAVSIRNEGIINSIEVDKNYVIITGEQRWKAAKIAGLKEVPVKIIEGIDSRGRFIRQVQENIHQNTMAVWDTAEALYKIMTWLSKSAADLVRDKKHI